jgi:beta-galactosidase
MSLKADGGYFIRNDKPHFIISGEIHYFRLNANLWDKHLKLLKESGANTASTYIPWDWHEYEERKFDFSGKTDPSKNLIKFIELCKKNELDLIVKPGPYILAEYKNQGLPSWLLEKCTKNAFALDENGKIISNDLMSYMSEEFLHHTFLWYDKIMPIIAEYQQSENGPISMLQVCNEVGVFQWLYGRIDYNPKVISLYKTFLETKYDSITDINRVYGTNYKAFNDLSAPVGKIENRQQYCAYFDFHLFNRNYYANYLDILTKKIRSFDIDVQLTHNIPGWIYGNAAELPMLISTYDEVMRTNSEIVFGLDHIPEFFSFRNAHSDLACNKILAALQPNAPVWAAEFQSGTREHQVKSYANDLEAFYFASLAHGIKGFNYYMFSQGKNPDKKGYFGKTFYFQTPLNSKAEKSSLYKSITKVNRFINKEKENLLMSENTSEICVGFYKPYFYTEVTTSQLLKEKRLDVEKLGLYLDPRIVREEVFFNGLLRILQTLNYNYSVYDLQNCSIESLLLFKQLWVVSTEFMDPNTQKLLVDYVMLGGHLILYPSIPNLDLYLNSCTILKDEFGINFSRSISPNIVEAMGIKDVYSLFRKKQIFESKNAEVISKTEYAEISGIRKKIEKGIITVLGFAFGYTSDEHLNLVKKIIQFNKIKNNIKTADTDIQYVARKGKKYSYLFSFNYHNEKKTFLFRNKEYSIKPFSYKILKIK